jgi:photosystem II stability/assembly factor-like uncharacterized protein
MELKSLYRSSDEGGQWLHVADTAPDRASVGTLPITGHVTDFAAVTDQRAFIGLSRNTLARTDDGGATWVFPLAFDADILIGIRRVMFVDKQHGWAATWQNLMFRTEDGGLHWEAVTVH